MCKKLFNTLHRLKNETFFGGLEMTLEVGTNNFHGLKMLQKNIKIQEAVEAWLELPQIAKKIRPSKSVRMKQKVGAAPAGLEVEALFKSRQWKQSIAIVNMIGGNSPQTVD